VEGEVNGINSFLVQIVYNTGLWLLLVTTVAQRKNNKSLSPISDFKGLEII
jgi:hypothetical protein